MVLVQPVQAGDLAAACWHDSCLVSASSARSATTPRLAPVPRPSCCFLAAGMAAGVPWGEYRMRLCLAGEVFSEEWRTLMAQRWAGRQGRLSCALQQRAAACPHPAAAGMLSWQAVWPIGACCPWEPAGWE